MDVIITAVISAGIPLISVAVGYGVLKAKTNEHEKRLAVIERQKVDKEVLEEIVKRLEEKLDFLINQHKKGV